MIYLKIFPRCARQFVKNLFMKWWKINDNNYIQKFSALRALICYELLRIFEKKKNHDKSMIYLNISALRMLIC